MDGNKLKPGTKEFYLEEFRLQDQNRLEWDIYFLRIAQEVSKHSKCLSRKIGSVLVRDKAIVSTGYNGAARGVKHCDERAVEFFENLDSQLGEIRTAAEEETCPRRYMGYKSGEGLHLCQAGHAERNALIQAARNGVSTLGTTLYCFCGQVCKDCAIEIVNAGVKELVYLESPNITVYDKYAGVILEESGIVVRTVKEELCK